MFKFFELKIKKEKGFTLVEMLTVLTIISILSLVVFVNYRQSGKQFALERSAHKLIRDIRKVSEMAMGTYLADKTYPRYGVFIEDPNNQDIQESKRYYLLFFDNNDNGQWRENLPDRDIKVPPGEIFYEKYIYLKNLSTTTNSGPNCSFSGLDQRAVHITFKPPAPKIYIKIGNSDCQEIKLTLGIVGETDFEKSIIINTAGLIDIE